MLLSIHIKVVIPVKLYLLIQSEFILDICMTATGQVYPPSLPSLQCYANQTTQLGHSAHVRVDTLHALAAECISASSYTM